MIKIGNVKLSSNVIMAPMAGVTDAAYRLIVHEYGAGLTCTEMVSAKGLFYNNKNNKLILDASKEERPIAVQLFGSDPIIMARMAEKIADDYDIIDVNMGCPVPKIVSNGEGSALMKKPELAFSILNTMSRVLKKPVTVKFRKGFDEGHVNAVEFAKMAEEAGVSAITIHGRTRSQMYSGKADWDIIRQVKEAVSIPVFGNGDIFEPGDAKRMIAETGVDGVAIARGARGNPWLINRTVHYLETGELKPEPSLDDKINMIIRHAKLMSEFKPEHMAVREMRKHIAWYTSGIQGSAKLRAEMNSIMSLNDIGEFLERLRKENA